MRPRTSGPEGPAAQASPQVKALIARYDAIARGDMAAALALSSEGAAEQLKAMPPEVMKQARAILPEMAKELRAAKRVVVRRDTAAVQTPDGSWFSLVLEGGAWKAAD